MALAKVNVGTTPNDGTGDVLRDAFITINDAIDAIKPERAGVAWDATTEYKKSDLVVGIDGTIWVATVASVNSQPTNSNSNWSNLIDGGAY